MCVSVCMKKRVEEGVRRVRGRERERSCVLLVLLSFCATGTLRWCETERKSTLVWVCNACIKKGLEKFRLYSRAK